MTVFVYALFFEDPWDEYYEHKLHAVFSSQEKAETYVKQCDFRGEWHTQKISLDFVPNTEQESWDSRPPVSFQLYKTVSKGKK